MKSGDYIKWLIWVPWICSIALVAIKSGGYKSIDFFFMTTHGISIGDIQGTIAYLLVLILLIVVPAFVNCPMSLPVEQMVKQRHMEMKECILCGTCVDGCKQAAITYAWGKYDNRA